MANKSTTVSKVKAAPICPLLKGVGLLPYQREEHGYPHQHWVVVRQSQSNGLHVAGPFHDRAAATEFLYDNEAGAGETVWLEPLYVPRNHEA